jgi:hypothetical protein
VEQAGDTTQISVKDVQAIIAWIETHEASAPASVRRFLVLQKEHLAAGTAISTRLRTMYRELQRAFGIIPKSEKRKSGNALDVPPSPKKKRPTNEREKLEGQITRSDWLSAWHGGLEKRHQTRAAKLKSRLSTLPESPAEAGNGATMRKQEITEDTPVEDIELTAEQQAESASNARAFVGRLSLGEGMDPALFSWKESLMTDTLAGSSDDDVLVAAELPENIDASRVLDTFTSTHHRYDISLEVRRLAVHVEKKVVATEDGKKVISARPSEVGPPRYSVTWGTLATLAVMVGQFAMPLNRIGTMLSTHTKRFTAGSLSRLLHYVAVRFVPIYLELADQLCDSDILGGDDTSCRVVEVASHFKKNKEGSPPWKDYRTSEKARQSYNEWLEGKRSTSIPGRKRQETEDDVPLGIRIAAELGFESPRRDGTGPKQSLNTTVLSGRSQPEDPQSAIVFYRSHLGSVGNLLETLLEKRNPAARDLIFQGDLSPSNLVTSSELQSRFTITQAGCMAHARRPFALYEDEDRVDCEHMLHLFKGLAIHEDCLDRHGRNEENVLAVRGTDSRALWNIIKDVAQEMMQKWSKATKLGTAARYIVNHFDKLTAYLLNPRIELTNNHRERMLRTEKLIEASSMFRRTLEGRFVLDIIRTVIQTSIASGVPPYHYIVDILKSDPNKIVSSPEKYTPHAWAIQSKADKGE